MQSFVGLVFVVVVCAIALHWAYGPPRPMLWPVAVLGVVAAVMWVCGYNDRKPFESQQDDGA